jgi:16S rRNA (uracil1498-N3)-methyltransferase
VSDLWVWLEALETPGPVVLPRDEASHVATRRLRVGDSLVVFDGRGRSAQARLESVEKRSTLIDVGPIALEQRPVPGPVLASAIPKGDRLGTMLQMLTQLGVAVWQPLLLEDSAVRKFDSTAARLCRILIESAKVARRAWRLDVLEPLSLHALLEQQAAEVEICFGDREGDSSGLASTTGLVAIGPEAGFSDRERKALDRAGARATSFGAHNLRIETAAVAAATAFNLASDRVSQKDGAL